MTLYCAIRLNHLVLMLLNILHFPMKRCLLSMLAVCDDGGPSLYAIRHMLLVRLISNLLLSSWRNMSCSAIGFLHRQYMFALLGLFTVSCWNRYNVFIQRMHSLNRGFICTHTHWFFIFMHWFFIFMFDLLFTYIHTYAAPLGYATLYLWQCRFLYGIHS